MHFLAQTTQSGGSNGALYTLTHGPMPILIIGLLVFYAMLILPKRKQDRQRREMLNNLKRGDEVLTSSGIIGKVVDPREDRVLVKVDESNNTKIWFSRSAITHVEPGDGKSEAKGQADKVTK